VVAVTTAGWHPAECSQANPVRAGSDISAAEGCGPLARRNLEFFVLDARNKSPLAGVSLVFVTSDSARATKLATNGDGRCHIPIPQHVTQFIGISARKEGFVAIRVSWRGDDVSAVLPASYTLALEPGTQIGGTVRDTLGRPIGRARVYVWFEREQRANEKEQAYLEDDYSVETDAQGRWRCNMMPADLGVKDSLLFRLIHADHVSEAIGYRRSLSIERLRAMTSVIVMDDGVALAGRVVNSRGKPITKAGVFLQDPGFIVDPSSLTPEQVSCLRTETDADGRFQYGHVEPVECQITIEAEGYARQSVRVIAGERSQPTEIRLTSAEQMEDAADVARLSFERMLSAEEHANDIPETWIMSGVFITAATAGLILILRWIAGRSRTQDSVE
jgi:hypothetical protein